MRSEGLDTGRAEPLEAAVALALAGPGVDPAQTEP
jgi:hypothetical protein